MKQPSLGRDRQTGRRAGSRLFCYFGQAYERRRSVHSRLPKRETPLVVGPAADEEQHARPDHRAPSAHRAASLQHHTLLHIAPAFRPLPHRHSR